jgi:hypothetical protein
MGPDRDAGVEPTQVTWATGGDGANGGMATGVPASTSGTGDPPTIELPAVPAGPGPRAGGGRENRSRRQERRREERDRRQLAEEREQLEQERERLALERRRREREPRSHRGLQRAIWVAAVALILAVGALVATELHTWHVFDSSSASPDTGAHHEASTERPSATLDPVSIQGYSAAYNVTAETFSVTVSTDRPTWVEARSGATGPTLFAGELPAGAVKPLQANGPLWVQVGAGGSTLVVKAEGKVIGTLRPLLAPWEVSFTPTGSP